MSIKSFFIALIIVFVLYEIISIIIGVIKKKKALKNLEESEVLNNDNVSEEDNQKR